MIKLPVFITGLLLVFVCFAFGQGVTRQEYTGLDKYLLQGRPEAASYVGVKAAEFLEIPADARGVGMAEAYSAVAHGSGSLWWNPAGIAFMDRYESSISHFQYSNDISYTYLSAAIPILDGKLVAGGVFGYFDIPSFPITTVAQPQGTGQKYDAYDYQLGGSVAYKPHESVAIGVTVKRVVQDMYGDIGLSAVAVDFGGIYRFALDRHLLSMSLVAQNYGTNLKSKGPDRIYALGAGDSLFPDGYDDYAEDVSGREERSAYLRTHEYELPGAICMGMAYTLSITQNSNMTAAFEYRRPRHESSMDSKSFGLEFNFPAYRYLDLSLRTGWLNRNRLNPIDNLDAYGYTFNTGSINSYTDFCAGAGLQANLKGVLIRFDYAYRDTERRHLSGGLKHYFSLGVGI